MQNIFLRSFAKLMLLPYINKCMREEASVDLIIILTCRYNKIVFLKITIFMLVKYAKSIPRRKLTALVIKRWVRTT